MHVDLIEEMMMSDETEDQRLFALSRMETQLTDPAIDAALLDGKYVVVIETLAHCSRTDATMGTRSSLASTHDTRDEANAAADEVCVAIGDDYDTGVVVLPRIPRERVTLPTVVDDNVPF